MNHLTARQSTILKWIIAHPGCSLREIGREFLMSDMSAICHARALQRKGYIDWKHMKSRTIRVIMDEEGDPVPPAPRGYETAVYKDERWAFHGIPSGCRIERLPKKVKKTPGFLTGDYLIVKGRAGKKELGFDGSVGRGRGKRILGMYRQIGETT